MPVALLIRYLTTHSHIHTRAYTHTHTHTHEKANEYVIKSGDEGRCMYFVGSTPQQTIGSGVHLAEDLRKVQRFI